MDKSNFSVNLSEEVIKVEEAKKSNSPNAKGSNAYLFTDSVELVDDNFGVYCDEHGNSHNIKRFTWKNKNKIQVQVISYGARITSMKLPDRKGSIDDIVLGFDDIAGYIYNKDKYFGATIGRTTNVVKNGTFAINNKQHWVTINSRPHHYNGGRIGLDQVVWTTFVDDKRVIMSYVSPHMSEGYPGDLLIRIIFELSAKNEFNIRMEAQCTQPTIVNLSNLTYFNLGGHHSGSNELYKHTLTLNCNCFTPQIDDIPSGIIMNVVHSGFDFQIPKVLGKVMGIVPKDGFNQNLCVNRGMDQDDCFIARVLHPPSGRLLEIYSNQYGVHLNTANDFGYGDVMTTEQLLNKIPTTTRKCEGSEPLLRLYEKVHQEIQSSFSKDGESTFKEIYDLIKKIKEFDNTDAAPVDNVGEEFFKKHGSLTRNHFVFTELQIEYLNEILKVLCDKCDEDACEELKEIIAVIISLAKTKDQAEKNEKPVEKQKEDNQREGPDEKIQKKSATSNVKVKGKNIKRNSIPDYYKSTNKIIGKERAHYKTHGGMALQTQNYPGCANYKNFPDCVLKPGETYVHTITYKFWIRAGNPSKWIKKNSAKLVKEQ